MALVRYLTHPQVCIDPKVPITDWCLSQTGRDRVTALVARDPFAGTAAIVSSDERKAVETAGPIAAALGLVPEAVPDMREIDRSATGYLPVDAFEAMADRFFARPGESAEGWERAIDAQKRILAATENVLDRVPEGEVLLVGHGGVGTLLWCALSGLPISRVQDQPANGGGNSFVFDRETRAPVQSWTPMELL